LRDIQKRKTGRETLVRTRSIASTNEFMRTGFRNALGAGSMRAGLGREKRLSPASRSHVIREVGDG
jgi:hypothetical protein